MNIQAMLEEIQDNADLLTRSDEWLEQERETIATEMTNLAAELRAVMTAQRVKRALQQKNLVAVPEIVRNSSGEINDVTVRILNLPDAIVAIEKPHDEQMRELAALQRDTWRQDGYDIETSIALR